MLGAKGLRGEVRVEPLTDLPDRLREGALLFLEDEANARRVTSFQSGGRVPVLGLEGIGDREAAAAIAGRYLEVEAEAPPAGSYWWHEIVGLRVSDESGADLGEVVEVFRAGENEVYRVVGPAGEVLLPALRDVVRAIDLPARTMTVRYEAEELG